MITIECDNCEQSFEVDPAEVGEKVACPHCNDVNRVPQGATTGHAVRPASTPQPKAKEPAWPAGLPPDSGPEQFICTVRPALFRAHPFRSILLLLGVGGGVALAVWALPSADLTRKILGYSGLAVVAGLALLQLKWWVRDYLCLSLRISNKRTVRQEGIIRRNTSEVLHDHVRDVEIRQSFLQRLCNVGYLGISSSAQGGIEIEVRDIPSPYKVKALIDQYRNL